jgi:prepilin-type N-terminal cleavage/methylation domain-containing protein
MRAKGFTLLEILITIFLISLISSILFSTFHTIKHNINWTETEAEYIRSEDSLINFLNTSFKYLYINQETDEIIDYAQQTDYLNNRKDIINFYSTYPNQIISNIKIFHDTLDDDKIIVYNVSDNDTYIIIEGIEKFQIDFVKNDKVIMPVTDAVLKSADFDYLNIDLVLNKKEYNLIIKPFILTLL